MKIAIIWWWDKASWIFDNWRDGHRTAIEELAKKHHVGWYLDKTMPDPGECDFLLFWSSSNEDYFDLLYKYKEPKGLCLTTNPQNVENLRKMNIVFVESTPIYEECRALGLPVIKAFGTDTDFFSPGEVGSDITKSNYHHTAWSIKKIKYFYPATFSPWKRQSDIAHLGKDLLCIGTVQPDGQKELEACKKNNVKIMEGYFPANDIKGWYRRAENVIIPAIHGSERTVLEAMSMNILPEILHPDINKKANSYLIEYAGSGEKTPRDFTLKRYSHKIFAKQLLKGIKQCLKK